MRLDEPYLCCGKMWRVSWRRAISKWASDGGGHGRKSGVVWDLSCSDRVPSILDVSVAVLRVMDIARALGRVVQTSAYSEPRLCLFGRRPKAYAEELLIEQSLRPMFAQDDGRGYRCSYCGRSMRTHRTLVLHFKEVHARERGKQLSRLSSAKNEIQRMECKMALAGTREKYKASMKDILMPGELAEDGLSKALEKAGFNLQVCADGPARVSHLTAAEHAILNSIWHALSSGVSCICFVCDSPRLVEYLEVARQSGLRIVGVGSGRSSLCRSVDLYINWGDVASGYARVLVSEVIPLWFPSRPKQGPEAAAATTTLGLQECSEVDYASSSETQREDECSEVDYVSSSER